MSDSPGVLIKPIVTREMDQYVDGYGNSRQWRKYNKSLGVSRFTIQPNPFQNSITFRANVRSEEPRDPNNSTGAIKNVKKGGGIRRVTKRPAPKRYINYLVTVRFHKVEFKDEESKQFNQRWDVAGREVWSRVPRISSNSAMLKCQCFTGDTEVLLADGTYEQIKNLVGKEVEIVAYDQKKKRYYITTAKNIRSYGNKKVFSVEMDNGKTIKATPDHKFLNKDGEWKRLDSLTKGESLTPIYMNDDNSKFYHKNNYYSFRRKSKEREFYAYIFCDPTKDFNGNVEGMNIQYEPFYVGKGKGTRAENHFNFPEGTKTPFYKKLKSMLDKGIKPIILKAEMTTEQIAFDLEESLIEGIGTRFNGDGPLLNIRKGGDGESGFTSRKVVERMKKNNPMFSPEIVEKVQRTRKERGLNVGCKDKSIYTKEVREKMSKSAKEKFKKNPQMKDVLSRNMSNVNKRRKENGELFYFQTEEGQKASRESHRRFKEEGTGLYATKNHLMRKGLEEWVKNLPVGSHDISKAHKTVGYADKYKLKMAMKKLDYDGLIIEDGFIITKTKEFNHKVESISGLGEEEVFCLESVDYGNFVVKTSDNSGVVVKNCRDFMMTHERPLALSGGLWPNNVWTKYQRLTPKGTGYPERNPRTKMGYCKHVATLLQYMNDSGLVNN